VNLTQLEYFHAVCTYQSISAAAEYLHISQPSLSVAIREMEQEYGLLLFQRHHRGMRLTPEGEQLLNMSSNLMKQFHDLEQKLYAMGNQRKLLRLGVPPMIGSLLLPQIYGSFTGQHPDILLEITEGGRKELLSRLLDDALDMVDCMLEQAAQYHMDEKLIMAIAHTESTFYSDAVSYADYKGLMQTGDVLAEEAGYSPDALFDPEVSIAVGTEYICDQLESFDQDVCLALTAYNQGPGAVYGGTYDTDYAELTMRRVENIKTFLSQGGYSQP